MFLLGNSGLILSLLLATVFPIIFIIPGTPKITIAETFTIKVLTVDLQTGKAQPDKNISFRTLEFKPGSSVGTNLFGLLKIIIEKHCHREYYYFRFNKSVFIFQSGNKAPPAC